METFDGRDLRGSRFVDCDLSGVVMRGVDVGEADIDSPWLFDGVRPLLINGVDVAPFVDRTLNERFPGRAERRAETPEGLRSAWARVEAAWDGAIERAAAMPAGTVDASVGGEWSFSETLRHLVLATDMWLRRAVLGVERPFHPLGLPDSSPSPGLGDFTVYADGVPDLDDVLAARAERTAMVRDVLASSTPALLDEPRPNPHTGRTDETGRSCLHTVLDESWEHLRFATRDLDALAAGEA